MGFFSFNCKACGHPMLSVQATDKGLNDWMADVVALTSHDRFHGVYDGYGRVGDQDVPDAAYYHEACWEMAGRPGYDGTDSESAADQGWFFDDGDHDVVDPRVTDEAERADRLRKGVEARSKARYDQKAREVYDWVTCPEMGGQEPWEQRFNYHRNYKEGQPVENSFWVEDRFDLTTDVTLTGTEDEVRAELARMWEAFVKSPEVASLVARAEEMKAEAKAQYLEALKAEGRYTASYRPSKVKGDTVAGRGMHREMFYVLDKITYQAVATFDYEGEPKDFHSDPGYSGNHSPEWEARVEENREDTKARRQKATDEAKRLNDAWAAAGYPEPEEA